MKTKEIKIGNVLIGNGNSIKIQSMTTTKTDDIISTVKQINQLASVGCDIARVSVLDKKSALCLNEIKQNVNIPIVADIHFDYKLALLSVINGADKIRINPGNIGLNSNLVEVLDCCKTKGIPIRIGVNGGSIDKTLLNSGLSRTDMLVESCLNYIEFFEKHNFYDIILSIKSSSVIETIEVNKKIAKMSSYPLHIGLTEAGTLRQGIYKSSIAIGSLLSEGIGDTIRVSLTADPIEEIYAAKEILKALDLDKNFVEVISCPTCGRCQIDLINIAEKVNDYVKDIKKPFKIAVMGCVVNGVGEAGMVDLGIAGGLNKAVFFKKGQVYKTVEGNAILEEFLKEIDLELK